MRPSSATNPASDARVPYASTTGEVSLQYWAWFGNPGVRFTLLNILFEATWHPVNRAD